MLLVAVVVVVFCRSRMQVHHADAASSVDVSTNCSGQRDDVERLLPTNDLLNHRAGLVDDDDDDDDDELHRGRASSSSSNSRRLDFDVTRLSINSRRCLVETEEVDSERMLFSLLSLLLSEFIRVIYTTKASSL